LLTTRHAWTAKPPRECPAGCISCLPPEWIRGRFELGRPTLARLARCHPPWNASRSVAQRRDPDGRLCWPCSVRRHCEHGDVR
jgi:hypothetical protein